MAAVVECDACHMHFKPEKIKHIRVHKLSSAEQYLNHTEEYFDLCPECYEKIKSLLNLRGEKK